MEKTGTKDSTEKNGRKNAIIGVIAGVVVLALAGCGLAYGLHVRDVRATEARALAAAQLECDRSIDSLTAARGRLAKRIRSERTQNALKLTDDKVSDEKTLTTLKNETKNTYSVSSCKTSDLNTLENHAKANQKAEKAAAAQSVRLTAAINAVEKSRAVKDEADRKAAEQKKTEEAKKQQEAQKAAAATQAASSAPVERQSSSSHSSASSHSSTVRRQSSAPRRSYTAPRRSYQAPRRTYTAPRRTYTAPRRSYTPARRTYAPRRSYTPAPRRTYTPRRSNPAPSRPAPRNNGGAEPDWVKNALKMGHVDKNAERVLG